jgi:hypothetical protein
MNTQDHRILVDRTSVAELPKALSKYIEEHGLITGSSRSGNRSLSFCGYISTESQSFIVIPRSTTESAFNPEHFPTLFTTLLKYQNDTQISDMEDETDSIVTGSLGLNTIKEVLSDFRTQGIYRRTKRFELTNGGKQNWRKTIAKSQSFIVSGSPLYTDYIGSASRLAQREASRIHAYIINKLIPKYDFLFFERRTSKAINEDPPRSTNKDYMLAVLFSELNLVYEQNSLKLVKDLIRLIKSHYNVMEKPHHLGIKKFEYIWEHILRSTVRNVIDLNKELPAPVYIRGDKEFSAFQKSQRTDIVVQDSDGFSIIDAKYYSADSISNAPGWHDLVKQFFYEVAVRSVYPESIIRNFFVFPGEKRVFTEVYMKNKKTNIRDKNYGRILLVYISPLEVMIRFVSNDYINALTE